MHIHSVGKCEANSVAPTGGAPGDFISAGGHFQAPGHSGHPASGDLTSLQVREDGSADAGDHHRRLHRGGPARGQPRRRSSSTRRPTTSPTSRRSATSRSTAPASGRDHAGHRRRRQAGGVRCHHRLPVYGQSPHRFRRLAPADRRCRVGVRARRRRDPRPEQRGRRGDRRDRRKPARAQGIAAQHRRGRHRHLRQRRRGDGRPAVHAAARAPRSCATAAWSCSARAPIRSRSGPRRS